MAKLEKKMKEVVEGVVLTLTEAEANALAKALGATAGSAREIENVWTALADAGYSGTGFNVSKTGQFRIDTVNHW